MRLYIPSMGRATRSDILSGPLADLPLNTEATYVVPESEVDAYDRALGDAGFGCSVPVVGCDTQGIAATRHWIGRHAELVGEDKFVMMDDDIRFLVRRSPETWQLRGTQPHEVDTLLIHVERWLDTHAHVGVSAREGNNRIGVGDDTLVAENTRTLRFLAYRTEDFLSVQHGRVEVMEDFDVNLQLLKRRRPNVNIHYWAQGQKMTNAPGGCSTYRSHEVHERSAHRLAELHPGLVRLRQKENKTDREGFGTRTEVTIQWKKAFETGVVA